MPSSAMTLFKKVDYSLSKLIADIEFGDVGLPDIQRPFVWKSVQVRDLFDSMFRGFPVGYLLFWANNGASGVREIGTGAKQQDVPKLLIIDGQQRLTSLYAVFKDAPVLNEDYQEQKLRIAFKPAEGTFDVTDAAIERDPEWISDISGLWTENPYKTIQQFLGVLQDRREVDAEEEEAIIDNIQRLFNLQDYPFTSLEISSEADEESVADIFVRINSEGTQLGQADFILTLLSVFWDVGRRNLEDFCRKSRTTPERSEKASPFNHFIEPDPDQLLRADIAVGFRRARLRQVYSILRGKDPETGEFSAENRNRQFETLRQAQERVLDLTNWHNFFHGVMKAGFRSGQMISSENTLIYCYALYVIGREDFSVSVPRLQRLVGSHFWMTNLTGRYTSSPESSLDQDLGRLRDASEADAFEHAIREMSRTALTSDFWEIALPAELETSSSNSPYVHAYHAAQNLLNAQVLFSEQSVAELFDPALRPKKRLMERHHLFPRALLGRMGIDRTRDVNQAANYALVEYPDNISISDQHPRDYFPRLMQERYDADEREQVMRDHALPENWWESDYDDFLVERRVLMAEVMRRAAQQLMPWL